MVVEAGVVVVHPADQPDGDVVVAQQLLVDARARIVGDEVTPQLGTAGEPRDVALELGAVEVAAGGTIDHAATRARSPAPCSRRAGLTVRSAAVAALPSRLGTGSPTTGRSEPWTSASMPVTRMTASSARGP